MEENTGEIKIINKSLERFARINDKPLYRLVWSDNQLEHRRGTFRDFVGDLFIREFTGVREVPKYPWIKDRWVIEMFITPDNAFNPTIPDSQWGSYEPLFVFESAKGEFLKPTLKVCEFICQQNERFRLSRPSPLTRAAELRNLEKLKEDKEIQDFMDQIDTSPMQSLLHTKEAIGYTKGLKDV